MEVCGYKIYVVHVVRILVIMEILVLDKRIVGTYFIMHVCCSTTDSQLSNLPVSNP